MVLSVLAEVGAVGVEHGRGVVIDARHVALVDRDDHRHVEFLGVLGHQLGGRAGAGFGRVVPLRILARAEVGTVEDLLQSEDLAAALSRFLDQGEVFLEASCLDFFDVPRRVERCGSLNQADLYVASHEYSPASLLH